jgi:hypothetical protein
MSPMDRRPAKIGRAERTLRDDRVFVVATEDTHAPEQYFRMLSLPRVKVVVLATPVDSGKSAPSHVVERLKSAFDGYRQRTEIQSNDEFWVPLDTDHHFDGRHLTGTLTAMKDAAKSGFKLAISNPCFELWLLLHHTDVQAGTVEVSTCSRVNEVLRVVLPGYSKNALSPDQFTRPKIEDAVKRARRLAQSTGDHAERWPKQAGTQIHRLMEQLLASGY